MKYQAPTQGHYESGLIAKLMYNIVDSLIKKRITQEDIGITNKKYHADSPEKLWEKPEIKSELEDFIMSYLFTNLNEPLPGFEEIFKGDKMTQEPNLEAYRSNLEQYYGSTDKAHEAIYGLSDKIIKRGERLGIEAHKIRSLKKGKQLIINNAADAFGQLVTGIYGHIDLTLNNFRNQIQS